jgi:hypothetical protein
VSSEIIYSCEEEIDKQELVGEIQTLVVKLKQRSRNISQTFSVKLKTDL